MAITTTRSLARPFLDFPHCLLEGNRFLRAGFGQVERTNVVKFLQLFHDLFPFRHGKENGLGSLILVDDVLWMKGVHRGNLRESI